MKRFPLLFGLATAISVTALIGCSSESDDPDEPQEMTEEQLIERGGYLVQVMDCRICHSPKIMVETDHGLVPKPDPNKDLSGHPANQPLDLSGFDMSKTPLGPWVFANGDFTAYAGPWGISYGANITPDSTGIGAFTLENFVQSFQHGKFKGGEQGRLLMPPMPWQNMQLLPEDDVVAIYTYLMKGVAPVENVPPSYTPPAGPPPGMEGPPPGT